MSKPLASKKRENKIPWYIPVVFVLVGILALVNIVQTSSSTSFTIFDRAIAAIRNITGIPAANTGLIINTLQSGYTQDKNGNPVQIRDSGDRCEVIDPNLPNVKKVYELGKKAAFGIPGENIGGFNLAPIIDFTAWRDSSDDGSYTMISYAQSLGMSYFLGMVLEPGSVDQTVSFINEINQSGLLPIVRLCYPGACGFRSQGDIENFFRNVSTRVGPENQFIAILGPNEPGTAGEMQAFGVPANAGGYDTLVSWANGAASGLQQFRVVNGGPMYLAPSVFNLSNTQNDDVLNYLRNGNTIQPQLFDFLLGNAYDLPDNKAYSQYNPNESAPGEFLDANNPSLSVRNVKAYVDSNGLRFILTEFGSFTGGGGKEQAVESFKQFCDDPSVVGVMFFRSFSEFEKKSPIPRPELYPYDDIAEIIGDCKGGIGGSGFSDLSWQSCNFDSCIYDFEYSQRSKAVACGAEANPSVSPTMLVRCSDVGNAAGDCIIKRYETLEVSMPIKQFGSNSPFGTELNPYLPVCAQAALMLGANAEYDAINQFAGKLTSGNLTYPMPWLGSAINCASQILPLTQGFLQEHEWEKNFHPGSRIDATYAEIKAEIDANTSVDGQPVTSPPELTTDQQNKIIDERAICTPEGCVDKAVATSAQVFDRAYSPLKQPQRYEAPKVCAESELVVKNQASNYIIGPEILISDEKTTSVGYSDEMCRRYAGRNSGLNDAPTALGKSYLFGEGPFECFWNPERTTQVGSICGQQPGCLANDATIKPFSESYKDGNCVIAEFQNSCLSYKFNEQDEIYVVDDSATPNIPTFDIEGAYDALYAMYQKVQYELKGKGLKVVFRENIGWKAEANVKVRDANRPFDQKDDHPYLYAADAGQTSPVQCSLPNRIFQNDHYLGKGNAIGTKEMYYDWLGYLDILQEFVQVYQRSQNLTQESVYKNPFLNNPEYELEELPLSLRKDLLLRTGEGSLATSFPIFTCDDIEYMKIDKANTATKYGEEGQVLEPTCIADSSDITYQDELGKFLCSKGYEIEGLCSDFSNICVDVGGGDNNEGETISLIYPTSVTTVSSPFGVGRVINEKPDFHKGVDFGVLMGSPVFASASGVVEVAGFEAGGFGYYVKIKHSNGFVTLYAHNEALKVTAGQQVNQGEVIATSGNTGNSTGPHVHLELRRNSTCVPDYSSGGSDGCAIDPMPYLNGVISEGSVGPIFECFAPDDFVFTPGVLSCKVDTKNLNDGIDWQAVERQIEARVEAYNLDNNDSYTWLANLEVPEKPSLIQQHVSFLGNQQAYERDLAQRQEMTRFVLDRARQLGINPRFAYALWVEETAGSALGSKALGCLYFRNGTQTGPMPVGRDATAMRNHLDEQLRCLQTYVTEFPEFSDFMCTYSGEVGRPKCDINNFVNNPNFPTNFCKYYFFKPI